MRTERSTTVLNPPGLAVIVVLIVAWQSADTIGWIRFTYVPAPIEIGSALLALLQSEIFWGHSIHTLGAVLAAWVVALVVGVCLGFLLAMLPALRTWTLSSVNVLRTLPAVALVPVVLMIFGFSIEAEIIVAVVVLIWPTTIATCQAVQNTHPRLDDVARSFGIRGHRKVLKLLLPAAWPSIVVAARLALTLSIILVVVTEMIGNPDGLGYALFSAQQSLRPAEMWCYLLWIGTAGIALQALLNFAARSILPGLAPVLRTGVR